MNRNRQNQRPFMGVARTLLLLVAALSSAPALHAQTGFLGIAGVVKNAGGTGQNGIRIQIRNTATNRTETTTTPSTTGAATGFFFVALSDFSGNRAAAEGDTLAISAFNGTAQISASPASYVVTSGDISSSLVRKDITIDTAVTSDNTPPSVTLALSASDANNVAAGNLTITANFNEDIASTSTVKLEVTDPTGAKTQASTVTRVGARQYTGVYTVVGTNTGLYSIGVSGAKDAANNENTAATNNTFRVGSTTANAPVLAIAKVTGSGQVTVPILLTTAGRSIGAFSFKVNYSPAQGSFVKAAAGSAAVAAGYSAASNESTKGQVNITVFGVSDSAIGAGESVQFTFQTTAGLTNGTVINLAGSALDMSDTSAVNIDGETIESGSITVGASAGGRTGQACFDVNNNGSFSASSDLQFLINRILEVNDSRGNFLTCPNTGDQTCFDVNNNGSFSASSDLQFLINRILEVNDSRGNFLTCPTPAGKN
ncbi:MAG: hypothetical protein HY816_16025 [Candidatus Wallbacteria bacterium]|nr:hypothetical protein [Candidatus Wallbacteria bacterium]